MLTQWSLKAAAASAGIGPGDAAPERSDGRGEGHEEHEEHEERGEYWTGKLRRDVSRSLWRATPAAVRQRHGAAISAMLNVSEMRGLARAEAPRRRRGLLPGAAVALLLMH